MSAALAAACAGEPTGTGPPGSPRQEPRAPLLSCTIPIDQIFDGGVGKDGIPALNNPTLVPATHADADYLLPGDRVIGLVSRDGPVAVPLNILWWHEVVNLDLPDRRVAVTHCPLTGSSLVFDRAVAGGAEFGVSGLLFRSNLILYDRSPSESLWPQMTRAATCGEASRTPLPMVPSFEMTWAGWKDLHPDTRVVSRRTGHSRNYRVYPYGDYDRRDNFETLFPVVVDTRRPPKERVLGIPIAGDGGIALPFGELAFQRQRAVHITLRDGPAVVLWDSDAAAAVAFFRTVGDTTLHFDLVSRRWVDRETGSVWSLAGHATEGPLAGTRLRPVAEAYVAFWFAWAAFQPETVIWDS